MQACLTHYILCFSSIFELYSEFPLMPPAYVRPCVKRQKNDAADAEAIFEAVTRTNMRFVETKSPLHPLDTG